MNLRDIFFSKNFGPQASGGDSGGSAAVIEPLTVTENGEYTPGSGVDGFSPVTVNVEASGGGFGEGANSILIDILEAQKTEYSSEEEFTINCAAFRYSNVESVYLPNVTINATMFENCAKLKSVVLKTMGSYATQVFFNCVALTNVEIDWYALGIGFKAFSGCSSLEYLKLRGSTSFGMHYSNWFDGCKKLKTLIIDVPKVVGVGYDPLSSTPIAPSGTATDIEYGTGYIYVPAEYIEEYKVATNWATYADRFRAIEDYPDICGEVTS